MQGGAARPCCTKRRAGSTRFSWPRSGGRGCRTRWTPCANGYKVSLVDRTFHGALIDARLLAEVYLELRGGKERVLDLTSRRGAEQAAAFAAAGGHRARPHPLAPRSTEAERERHLAFLAGILKDQSLWTAYGVAPAVQGEA